MLRFRSSCSCPFFRMDSSSSSRIAVKVPPYVEVCGDVNHVSHCAVDSIFQKRVSRGVRIHIFFCIFFSIKNGIQYVQFTRLPEPK